MSSKSDKFRQLQGNKPSPGDVLRAKDDEPVPVFVERRIGDSGIVFMMFCNALIDYECTGWYLTHEDTPKALKVLILPESQEILIENNNNRLDTLEVSALRVVRHNEKGTALICELLDLDDPYIYDERDIDPRN
tara:strand:- start:80 stop:481 length:402 start_codon:yes stop_codon:yes gene_type:complete